MSFMKLPPELRNMIYEQLVISPTGFIEAIDRTLAYRVWPEKISSLPPSFFLIASPNPKTTPSLTITSPHSKTPTTESNIRRLKTIQEPHFLSTSLLLVNKQINQECAPLFWERNTFIFQSPSSLLQNFKVMGEIPSRLINRLYIPAPMEWNGEVRGLKRMAKMLVKRKKSELREVECGLEVYWRLLNEMRDSGSFDAKAYEERAVVLQGAGEMIGEVVEVGKGKRVLRKF